MLIPITIGYDKNKKIIKDLANLKHLFVYVNEEQMDFLLHSKRNALY